MPRARKELAFAPGFVSTLAWSNVWSQDAHAAVGEPDTASPAPTRSGSASDRCIWPTSSAISRTRASRSSKSWTTTCRTRWPPWSAATSTATCAPWGAGASAGARTPRASSSARSTSRPAATAGRPIAPSSRCAISRARPSRSSRTCRRAAAAGGAAARGNLSIRDTNLSDIAAADAVGVFASPDVAAVGTYEPVLSQVVATHADRGAHIVVSSKDYADLILDIVMAHTDELAANPDKYVKFLRGIYRRDRLLLCAPGRGDPDHRQPLLDHAEDFKATLPNFRYTPYEEARRSWAPRTSRAAFRGVPRDHGAQSGIRLLRRGAVPGGPHHHRHHRAGAEGLAGGHAAA